MEGTVLEFLEGIVLGERVSRGGLTVFPLHHPASPGPRYLTLQEALQGFVLEVTEKDAGGSVPELLVKNGGELPVLMLDGEELVGAKQNRVLNASILVAAGVTMTVPVSCTEAGRWSYRTERFEASPYVMPRQNRRDKSDSVPRNLEAELGFRSDQGMVWEGVDRMASQLGTGSPAMAMREVLDGRRRELDGFIDELEPLPGQKGLLVFIGEEPAGLDMLSRPRAYAALHPKLLRSYAVDALLRGREARGRKPGFAEARLFLDSLKVCEEKGFRSAGLGWDHRYRSDRALGSALVWRKRVIHAAFFHAGDGRGDRACRERARMRDLRTRRHFRE